MKKRILKNRLTINYFEYFLIASKKFVIMIVLKIKMLFNNFNKIKFAFTKIS